MHSEQERFGAVASGGQGGPQEGLEVWIAAGPQYVPEINVEGDSDDGE